MGIGVAVHSSGELGIQLATMLHLGAVVPNLGYAADAHYHHLVDDVIVGGPIRYENGAIARARRAGLGRRRSTALNSRSTTSCSGTGRLSVRSRSGTSGLVSADPQPRLERPDAHASSAPALSVEATADASAPGRTTPRQLETHMSWTPCGQDRAHHRRRTGHRPGDRARDGARRRDGRTRPTSRPSCSKPSSGVANVTTRQPRRAGRRGGREGDRRSCRRSTCCSTARATCTTARSSTARRRTGTSASI